MSISVGVIGCGYWGPNLIRNFAESEAAELRWVCDRDARRLEKVARRYPAARATADCDQLFNDPRLDALVVATPVATHYPFARRALEAGKHVLVEKLKQPARPRAPTRRPRWRAPCACAASSMTRRPRRSAISKTGSRSAARP